MTDNSEKVNDNVRMSRYSWDYEGLGEAVHWFLMAKAYLDCSIHLFSEMMDKKLKSSFHHAKVATMLFEHSIELFLKAGIVQAGQEVGKSHNLQELYNQFRKLYPGKKHQFEGDIVSAVRQISITPYNVYTRYPTDNFGQLWPGNTHIDLVIWYKQLCLFVKDFERLEPLLKERYPQGSKKTEN